MNKSVFLVLLVFSGLLLYGQSVDYHYHTVEASETLYGLSRKYNVSIDALIGVNPRVSDGLNVGMVLLVPKANVADERTTSFQPDSSDANYIYHTVKPKETLYGISKKYELSIENIEKDNPELAEKWLQIGQVVRIAKNRTAIATIPTPGIRDSGEYSIRVVQAGETVYSITQAVNILPDQFFQLNPHTVDGLKEGQEIRLPAVGNLFLLKTQPVKSEGENESDYKLYQLTTEDNLSTLLQTYSITQDDLFEVNPELKEGLVAGRYIIIPLKKSILANSAPPRVAQQAFTLRNKSSSKLMESIGFKGKRSIYVLLPFKAGTEKDVYEELESGDENDNLPKRQKVKQRERDAQLSLEFYTGFQLAMDTLVNRGYQLRVKVSDSRADPKIVNQEVASIKAMAPDVVVGPLYAKHATSLAKQLESDTIFVFSPLSRGVDNKNNRNLVAVIPSKESEYDKIANYLNSYAEFVNIIFVNSDNPQARAGVKTIRSRMFASDNVSVKEVWSSRAPELSSHLHPTKENIFVVVDQQQAFLTDLVSKLYAIRNSNIRLLSTVDMIALETIELRYLNGIKYTTTDLFYIDYASEAVNQFVVKYRDRFNTEPTRTAFQGYDLGLYVAAVFENNSKFGHLPPIEGLVTKYNFQKSRATSGFTNDYVYLLEMVDFTLQPIVEKPHFSQQP